MNITIVNLIRIIVNKIQTHHIAKVVEQYLSWIVSCVVGIVQLFKHTNELNSVFPELLVSGSNDNLLFIYKGRRSGIPHKKHYAPQNARIFNGTFDTTNVGT